MKDVLDKLYSRRSFGIKPGLDVERALLAKLGNPQRDMAFLHVAGTNGKGSVCVMLAHILKAAGHCTGFYSSPHLVRFNERFWVDGEWISDSELEELVRLEEEAALEVKKELGQEPTFFESSTAIAFLYFKRKGVRLAVLETGMGGRLDATNVITPLVSVITRISLDHAAYLGATVPLIAREKAGIIKLGVPVVCGATEESAREVLREEAARKQAPLRESAGMISLRVSESSLAGIKVQAESQERSYGTLRVPLAGQWQLENLATVLATVETLEEVSGLTLDERQIRAGLDAVRWPGRCEVLQADPPLLLDGGHNPGAAEALVRALKQLLKDKPLGLVVGMCSDKDLQGFLHAFSSSRVKKLWAVRLKTERSRPSGEIAAAAAGMGWEVSEAGLVDAISQAEAWARSAQGAVCITGSLFLVGEVLEIRGEKADEKTD